MCFGGGNSYDPNQDVHPAGYDLKDSGAQVQKTMHWRTPAPTDTYTDPASGPAPTMNLTGQGANPGLNTKGDM